MKNRGEIEALFDSDSADDEEFEQDGMLRLPAWHGFPRPTCLTAAAPPRTLCFRLADSSEDVVDADFDDDEIEDEPEDAGAAGDKAAKEKTVRCCRKPQLRPSPCALPALLPFCLSAFSVSRPLPLLLTILTSSTTSQRRTFTKTLG
jgi:hypothetical protein